MRGVMNPKKILVIQLRRVGDVVFTLPVIHVLRKNYPAAQIDFLVEKPADQLVRLNPYLSETLVYDKEEALDWIWKIRKKEYDLVLDFHSNGRTLILTLFSKARVRAGFKGPLTRQFVYNRFVNVNVQKYIVEQKLDLLRALDLPVQDWDWGLKIPEPEIQWAAAFFKKGEQREKRKTERENRMAKFFLVFKDLTSNDGFLYENMGANKAGIVPELGPHHLHHA